MDFGFIRASMSDYCHPCLGVDWVVKCFERFTAYLIIIDKASQYVWVFLRKSKEPPTNLVLDFIALYGLPSGGVIQTDLGSGLAWSESFWSSLLQKARYIVEPVGTDSPSQNGGAEKWNHTLAVTTRSLLYGSGLPAQYWSAALLHAAYLHNRRVHRALKMTPFESWFQGRPNLKHLRIFGSRVCIKQSGKRRAKLDQHHFDGIFIGYMATNHNIHYIDIVSGIVKHSHHTVFD
jgi:transposase InsO family protein